MSDSRVEVVKQTMARLFREHDPLIDYYANEIIAALDAYEEEQDDYSGYQRVSLSVDTSAWLRFGDTSPPDVPLTWADWKTSDGFAGWGVWTVTLLDDGVPVWPPRGLWLHFGDERIKR